ncbi:MAG TPA: hypothetical protein VKS81_01955, partial [Bacteroidota bacterium]|nr:hypothetical protein [Bacteroidota bacterium]
HLQKLSIGGDIVISDAVANDPEVIPLLRQPDGAFTVEHFSGTLKGYAEQPFDLTRLVAWNKESAGISP